MFSDLIKSIGSFAATLDTTKVSEVIDFVSDKANDLKVSLTPAYDTVYDTVVNAKDVIEEKISDISSAYYEGYNETLATKLDEVVADVVDVLTASTHPAAKTAFETFKKEFPKETNVVVVPTEDGVAVCNITKETIDAVLEAAPKVTEPTK